MECLSAIQDAQDLIERLTEFNYRFARGDVGESVSWPECSANCNDALSQGEAVRVAKLCCPGAIWQESGAGTLINELIEDALQQLGGA
jgi:hypothetical protein